MPNPKPLRPGDGEGDADIEPIMQKIRKDPSAIAADVPGDHGSGFRGFFGRGL